MHSIVKLALLTLIRRWFRAIVDEELLDMLPLGTHSTTSFLPKASKTGTYSFKLIGSNHSYKLYSCINPIWAEEVSRATDLLRSQHVSIPRILGKRGRYILAEWIGGEDLRYTLDAEWNNRHEAIVQYQASIHNSHLPSEDESIAPISYIHDFLLPRFSRYALRWLTSDQLDLIHQHIQKSTENMGARPIRLSHPDFTHYNLVQTDNGMVVVDNETLHTTALWEYDVLNTANILFAPLGLKKTYLETYARYVEMTPLDQYAEFWEIIWLIRMSGGKLQVGATEEGKSYLIELSRRIDG